MSPSHGPILDVSTFTIGDRCPRCIERRVFAVDTNLDLWLCIPNAMPVPWLRDHMTEHVANELDNTPQADRERYANQMMGVLNGRS